MGFEAAQVGGVRWNRSLAASTHGMRACAGGPPPRVKPRRTHRSWMADAESDDDLADIRAVIQALRDHAEELRRQGVPVDDMVRDLERKVEAYRAAKRRANDLQAQDEEFERERVERRRELDAAIASLPPDLADGMSTTEYLAGISKRDAERRRRGRKGVGE